MQIETSLIPREYSIKARNIFSKSRNHDEHQENHRKHKTVFPVVVNMRRLKNAQHGFDQHMLREYLRETFEFVLTAFDEKGYDYDQSFNHWWIGLHRR